MRGLDASSAIYAWDNYPPPQFPGLWDFLAQEIVHQHLGIVDVALQEVCDNAPDCGTWIKAQSIYQFRTTEAVLMGALKIQNLLGVSNGNYHKKGVGENDVIIISSAKEYGFILITDEEKQPKLPPTMGKYKIPAVCALPQVKVECMNFLEYIKATGATFR